MLDAPVFEEAGQGDDAEVRRLLREHAMPGAGGAVRVSLEREPSLRDGQELEGGVFRTLLCREGVRGPVTGVGTVAMRTMMVGGKPQPLAYLTQLRLDERARGKRGLLVQGYERMGRMIQTPYVLTSILEENSAARRLLERGLRGMPSYRLMSAFHTFVMGRGARSGRGVRRLTETDAGHAAGLLREASAELTVAPHWGADELVRLLRSGTLTLLGVNGAGGLTGCVGIWDQSKVKQTVVRGYSKPVALVRPALNAVGAALGALRLPPVGAALRTLFLSHVAVGSCGEEAAERLLNAANGVAHCGGASLVGGAAPGTRLHALLAARAWSTMRSRIYSVHWAGASDPSPSVDGAWPSGEARVHLEVGLL